MEETERPLTIEEKVFARKKPDFKKLLSAGFVEKEGVYTKSILFLDDAFRADLSIKKDGSVSGEVIECAFEEPYLPLRVASSTSGYVQEVRNAYQSLLEEIAESCFVDQYFLSPQANRIASLVERAYHEKPSCPFQNPNKGMAFSNHVTEKWYGLVQNVERAKLQKKKKGAEGKIEILNLKSDEKTIQQLIKQPGVYPGWHMNKKNWLSITLDDSLSDQEIMALLSRSRSFTEGSRKTKVPLEDHVWIIPANPRYFNIVAAFKRQKTIIWKQSTHIEKGDLCYMYVGAPYSCILYKCEVKEVNIPYTSNGIVHISSIMKIHLLKQYPRDLLDARVLRHYGVGNVQGPRRMPKKLKEAVDKV